MLAAGMRNFLKNISFTKNEIKVIIFIITVLALGFAIKYYKEVINSNAGTSYDFSKSDSEFKKRSEDARNNKSNLSVSDTLLNEDDLVKELEASEDSLNKDEDFSTKIKKAFELSEKSININTASKEELIELPGIGESIAERIIIYREEKKGFKKIENIMKVKGIGKKKFENIKNYIKVE